jgi:LacI family transcriptional regulator
MATIRDVADLANVSIATVSRVLNESGYVSPELDQRVRQAIATLGYRRNALARNLRRNESLTVGVLIPDSSNPFFAEVAKGIEEICFSQGYTVVLCNTDENSQKAASYLSSLYQQRVAGFVVVTTEKLQEHIRQSLDDDFPIVIVDRAVSNLDMDSVVSDNYGGARQAVEHLISLGHRRIGFVVGEKELETIRSRWSGAVDAMHGAGIGVDQRLVYSKVDYLPGSGYAATESLLSQHTPPTAIFAFNDLMALGVLNYAQSHGTAVPEQLSVVGFDDILIASYAVPSLTTIAQPKYELGRTVAEILLQRIQGHRGERVNLVLPTQLVVRNSTARPMD